MFLEEVQLWHSGMCGGNVDLFGKEVQLWHSGSSVACVVGMWAFGGNIQTRILLCIAQRCLEWILLPGINEAGV